MQENPLTRNILQITAKLKVASREVKQHHVIESLISSRSTGHRTLVLIIQIQTHVSSLFYIKYVSVQSLI